MIRSLALRLVLSASALLLLTPHAEAQQWEVRGHGAPTRSVWRTTLPPAAPGFRGTLELRPADDGRVLLVLAGRDERGRIERFEGLVSRRALEHGASRYEGRVDRAQRFGTGAAGRLGAVDGAGSGPAETVSAVVTVQPQGVRGVIRTLGTASRVVRFESLPASTRRPIVLIHGAWVDSSCWDKFKARYELAGYEVIAPDWPLLGTPEAGTVGPREIVAHYAELIRGLDTAPILIGHSFGGLWVQKLLDQGLGAVGVAIDPAPPAGILLRGAAWKANAPAVSAAFTRGLFRRDLVLEMTFEQFQFGFVNRLGRAAQLAAYDRFVIPTTARVFRGIVPVDFDRAERAPLLLIAGSADQTITPEMVRAMQRRYTKHARPGGPRVDLVELPGRTHWLIQEAGWEEVADNALRFAERALEGAPR